MEFSLSWMQLSHYGMFVYFEGLHVIIFQIMWYVRPAKAQINLRIHECEKILASCFGVFLLFSCFPRKNMHKQKELSMEFEP